MLDIFIYEISHFKDLDFVYNVCYYKINFLIIKY